MKRTQNPDGTISFELSESDIESAIRAFICQCHPDMASGWEINQDKNSEQDYSAANFIAIQ